ncbi:MAG: TRAP transporter small permease [Bacillota bacterium]|nr:TRAP transporter small permease [Bacillota bacterium]
MKIIKWLDEYLEETILVVLLILITCIMGLQVFCRYALNNSLTWSEELTRYLFIYMAFISISYCTKKWISIRIDQVINLFSNKVFCYLQLALNVVLTSFYAYMSIHAINYIAQGIHSQQLSPALRIPMWIVQLAPFIGFFLATIRSCQQVVIEGKKIVNKDWETKEEAPQC